MLVFIGNILPPRLAAYRLKACCFRRVDYEVGHFSLCVWSAASSGVSGEVCGEFEAGVAAGADGGSGEGRKADSSR